jgi:cytochrome c-type biogenesis protein CcmH
MTNYARLIAAIAVLGCIAVLSGSGWAMSEEELERRVLDISNELRCPTCQAISVKDSDAAFSRQMRDKIRVLLQEGKSDEEIKAFFVASYGEWVLRAPKKEGVGLLLWVLPLAGIVAAGGLLFWRQRRIVRQRQTQLASVTPQTTVDADARARIRQDLSRFERGF